MKGKSSFIKDLSCGLLPTRSEQEIRDHETWFRRYLELNDRKKEVIQRWREKKEVKHSVCWVCELLEMELWPLGPYVFFYNHCCYRNIVYWL